MDDISGGQDLPAQYASEQVEPVEGETVEATVEPGPSAELAVRTDEIVVAEIDDDDAPYTDAAAASADVQRALELVRDGANQTAQGYDLLETARRKGADKALGYDSMDACIAGEFEKKFNVRIDRRARRELVVGLRREGKTTRQIGRVLGLSHPTTQRSLEEARELGEISAEEEPRPPKQSRSNGENGSKSEKKSERRRPLPDSFYDQVGTLTKIVTSWQKTRDTDERWASHLSTLARHQGEVERAVDILKEIADDFAAANRTQG